MKILVKYSVILLLLLNLSNFKTINVTDMRVIFYSCSSKTSLDLSHFNTNNFKDMREMFCYIPKKCKIIYNDSGIKESLKNEGISTKCYIF